MSGFNTVTLRFSKSKISSDNPCGRILSFVKAQSLTNSGKSLGIVWKFATGGPLGNQTFPLGCAPQESLITRGTSLGQICLDNPFGLCIVCPKLLVYSSEFWIIHCQTSTM